MSASANKVNLMNFTLAELQNYLHSLGEAPYRAQQIIQWMHQRVVHDFSQMTNLSQVLRDKLSAACEIPLMQAITEQISEDGTHKWLLRLKDGNAIETVFIPEPTRGTLCVSSQVGCALNCSFCSTGKEGFNRNLSLAEIIGQVAFAKSRLKDTDYVLTNVVMMGMGEPLLNYDAVVGAMELMLSDYAYGLSKYRVTLSTSGVIPMMKRLKQDIPVALAVSLHAPNNALRNELVPINKKHPLEELIPLCRDYFAGEKKRSITFEYVMLENINDDLRYADELIRLLDFPCKVNLIPFNPFPKTQYRRSSDSVIAAFQQRLIDAGLNTRVRRTRGEDIDGACGQLAGDITDRTGRHERWERTGRLIPT